MPLRVALMNPTYWPEVRRGSERLVHGLASTLRDRGHHVTILTTHPGPGTDTVEDGIRVIRARRPPKIPRSADREYFYETAPVAAMSLLRGDYDIAHAFFPVDAWAAVRARPLGGPPVAFSFHGIPVRQYLVARRGRLRMLNAAVRKADAVSVLSEAAAVPFRKYLLREPHIVPGGVFCEDFEVAAKRALEPTLICAASLGDPRKGGRELLEAFGATRERVPGANLKLAGGSDPFYGRVSLEPRPGVESINGDATAELAGAYASSWASVLPATGEAFGLVLVESMAAGTPPIALRDAASPEVLDGGVGTLVEPGDRAGLSDAMASALREPPSEAIRDACRERARKFDWSRVIESYEALYTAALERAGLPRTP